MNENNFFLFFLIIIFESKFIFKIYLKFKFKFFLINNIKICQKIKI